jgi:hypothetical protein
VNTRTSSRPDRWLALLVGLALVCASSAVVASEDEADAAARSAPQHRIYYDNLLLFRLNPLGLEDWLNVGYRYRLYRHSSPVFRDNHFGLAFTPTLSPGVFRIGGTAEVRPLSILLLSMGYYFVSWFGNFGFLQSYPSPRAAHSDSDIDAGDEAGRNYATNGSELQLKVQPIVKFGPVVVRDEINFYYSNMDVRREDTVYYNIRIDVAVPNRGWALTNDTDVLVLTDFGLVAGVRSTVTHALYDDRDFLPSESTDNPNSPTWRLGPLIAYVFADDLSDGFNKPTVLVIVNWWLKHRYRTGEDVNQAAPYFILGFKFEGQLWAQD